MARPTGSSSVTYQSTVKYVAEAVNQLNTRTTSVQEEKQANSYAHIFFEPNNWVMLLGACVKPQPLNYLLCTAKLRVFTTVTPLITPIKLLYILPLKELRLLLMFGAMGILIEISGSALNSATGNMDWKTKRNVRIIALILPCLGEAWS